MRKIQVYRCLGKESALEDFFRQLDPKQKIKLLRTIAQLQIISECELKEPHFKHFTLERYTCLYEIREKSRVLIRIIFAMDEERVLLLLPFIKRQPRDTMKALERALKIYEKAQRNPEWRMNCSFYRGELNVGT